MVRQKKTASAGETGEADERGSAGGVGDGGSGDAAMRAALKKLANANAESRGDSVEENRAKGYRIRLNFDVMNGESDGKEKIGTGTLEVSVPLRKKVSKRKFSTDGDAANEAVRSLLLPNSLLSRVPSRHAIASTNVDVTDDGSRASDVLTLGDFLTKLVGGLEAEHVAGKARMPPVSVFLHRRRYGIATSSAVVLAVIREPSRNLVRRESSDTASKTTPKAFGRIRPLGSHFHGVEEDEGELPLLLLLHLLRPENAGEL